jgi:prephenate dehydratase
MDFFKKYPKIKLVEDKDTETARRIQEKQLKGCGNC